MQIFLIGLNHKTAPVEVRERAYFSHHRLKDALETLMERTVEGCIILSTCNRTEIYGVTATPAETKVETTQFLADYHGIDIKYLESYLYYMTGSDAVQHLFNVTSGLNSMILGESQILGQVREALRAASESSSLSRLTSRLFHRAIRAGRRVRNETELGRNPLSVSYAGVQLAKQVLGELRKCKALLIGAGEAGQLVAKALNKSGTMDMTIANRTHAGAEHLARQLGGETIPYKHVGKHLNEFDIIITATESPRYVLTKTMVNSAIATRVKRELFLLDLSVPRTIDPKTSSLNHVNLFNIDDLSSIAAENLESRRDATTNARTIIEEERSQFMEWWKSLQSIDVIRDLHKHADEIRSREFSRAIRSLGPASPQQLKILDTMTRSIVSKILHDPTTVLKKQTNQTHLQAARELFQIPDSRSDHP